MSVEYLDLLSHIDTILEKQKEKKLRGLNDYNMVNVVRSSHHEVGMHSNVIYSLLNPNGLHYQGALFLSLFIEKVLGMKYEDFGSDISVNSEELTDNNRRIDFTIKSSKYYIGIEMKVNAPDSKNQIKDYYQHLKNEIKNDNYQEIKMYYLTKFGNKAPAFSAGAGIEEVATVEISFKENILNWLIACQKEVANITNLNVAIENYKDIVKKVTHTYKGNVMSIAEELIKPESNAQLITALKLTREMPKVKGSLLLRFFDEVKQVLLDEGFTDISEDISNRNRVVDINKSIQWFTTHNKSEKNIGLFFDCGFSNNHYFYIEAASKHLHYGVVSCTQDSSGKYELIDMPTSDSLQPWLEPRDWKNLVKWYSCDCGNIIDLNDDALKFLLNFKASQLKNNIVNSIKGMINVIGKPL